MLQCSNKFKSKTYKMTVFNNKVKENMLPKAITGIFALLLLSITTDQQSLILYIIIGFSHFLSAHYYQGKAGKITLLKFIAYIACLALCFYLSFQFTPLFILFAIAINFIHNLIDEIHLSNQKTTLTRYFIVIALSAILTLSTIESIYDYNILSAYLLPISLSFALLYIFNIIKNKEMGSFEVIIFLYALFILIINFANIEISAIKLVVFFFIMHHLSWCWSVFSKIRKYTPHKTKTFLFDLTWIIVLTIGLYAISLRLSDNNFLHTYFFQLQSTLVWASMHVIFTLRINDYKVMMTDAFHIFYKKP